MRSLLLTPIFLLLATNIYAADFYLIMDKCKSTIGYLVPSEDNLKTVDFKGLVNACTRISQKVSCEMEFMEKQQGIKGNKVDYFVHLDSPPMLVLTDNERSDYFVIDTNKHAVTMMTRIVDKNFAGTKICTGLYMTESERILLEEKKK